MANLYVVYDISKNKVVDITTDKKRTSIESEKTYNVATNSLENLFLWSLNKYELNGLKTSMINKKFTKAELGKLDTFINRIFKYLNMEGYHKSKSKIDDIFGIKLINLISSYLNVIKLTNEELWERYSGKAKPQKNIMKYLKMHNKIQPIVENKLFEEHLVESMKPTPDKIFDELNGIYNEYSKEIPVDKELEKVDPIINEDNELLNKYNELLNQYSKKEQEYENLKNKHKNLVKDFNDKSAKYKKLNSMYNTAINDYKQTKKSSESKLKKINNTYNTLKESYDKLTKENSKLKQVNNSYLQLKSTVNKIMEENSKLKHLTNNLTVKNEMLKNKRFLDTTKFTNTPLFSGVKGGTSIKSALELIDILNTAIYFDSNTRESSKLATCKVSVRDVNLNSKLPKYIDSFLLTDKEDLELPEEGLDNNLGELTAFYYALKIANIEKIQYIAGDSINAMSTFTDCSEEEFKKKLDNMKCNNKPIPNRYYSLYSLIKEELSKFEGKIYWINHNINPAD